MAKVKPNDLLASKAGNWYKHTNCTEYLNIGNRKEVTSTGAMLNTVQKRRQSSPPQLFHQKSLSLYHQQNPFSYHDNRNNIQLTGEYLGSGGNTRMLGRRLTTDDSQHKSDISSFLKHHGNEVTDSFFQTNYMLSHTEKTHQPAQHRRYTKEYRESSRGLIEPQTYTTKQFAGPPKAPKTSSQTLVSSLEPYQKHNAWKYTYHRHNTHDIYPKVWGDRCSVHLPTCKPRKRAMVVDKVVRGFDAANCA